MIDSDEQKSRLQKLKTLAERGSPGERDNAKVLLEKLCNKYDVNIDQLGSSDKIEMRWFKYKKGNLYKQLLNQCIYKTLGKNFESYVRGRGKHYTSEIGVECSVAESIEIELDYSFYSHHFEREMQRLLDMFIQKNKIFPPDNGEPKKEDNTKISEEDILLYQSIKRQTRSLQIEGGKK